MGKTRKIYVKIAIPKKMIELFYKKRTLTKSNQWLHLSVLIPGMNYPKTLLTKDILFSGKVNPF